MNLENRVNYLSRLADLDRFMTMIWFERQEISKLVDSLLNFQSEFIDIEEIKQSYLNKKMEVLSRIANYWIFLKKDWFPDNIIDDETESFIREKIDPKMFDIRKNTKKSSK